MYKNDELTIPRVTRNDSVKVAIYTFVALSIALSLIASTVWLFTTG